jgi:hypothetical protein
MFKIRLLTFCTVPHAAQFAPTICANLRWQPLQLLMVGPDAISLKHEFKVGLVDDAATVGANAIDEPSPSSGIMRTEDSECRG